MASELPKSPRPGRKLTVAVNIPKPSESKRFLEPSMPKSKSPSSHSEMSSKHKNGPHPPSSPRPSTPKFLQVRSPFGSPDGQVIMRRRHTVSVVEPSKVGVPAAARHYTYPSYNFFDDEPDVGKGIFDTDGVEHEAPNHQPLPASSSFFQQAMLDLKRRPGRTSQSSLDGEDSPTLKEIGTPSTRSNHPMRSPPVIEISDIEEKSENYSLDIEFNLQNDDDDNIFGRNGDENKLSSSAPDSFLHETRKSTMLRLQIARAQLSSSEHVLSRPSGKKPKDQLTTLTKKEEKSSAIPKSSRKSKQGALLSVDVSPLGGPLRKWKSTEDSLPSLSSTTPGPGDQHLVHSPFLSPPMMRRKGSVPAVLSTSPKLKQRSSLQDLQSSFKQQFGSPRTSNLSPRATTSTKRPSSAHVSSTSRPTWSTSSSLSSASDSSPTPSPRMKHETTEPSVKSNRGQHVSPLSLKTANMITQFITSAAASSSISGSTARKNLLPDTVTLPPVLDSSGRLRVHRRRDDSMRLAKQAVNSDCNDWMDNDNVKRRTKSVMGFAEA